MKKDKKCNKEWWCQPISLFVCAAILGIAYATINKQYTRSSARANYYEALDLLSEERPREAIILLREVVRIDPDVADFHLNLASAYSNCSQVAMEVLDKNPQDLYHEIMRETRLARTLSPDDLEISQHYAYLFGMAERFGVEADLEAVLEAWEDCLRIHIAQKQPKRSVSRTCLSATSGILLNLAKIESKLGHTADARKRVEEALELSTHSIIRKSLFVKDLLKKGRESQMQLSRLVIRNGRAGQEALLGSGEALP